MFPQTRLFYYNVAVLHFSNYDLEHHPIVFPSLSQLLKSQVTSFAYKKGEKKQQQKSQIDKQSCQVTEIKRAPISEGSDRKTVREGVKRLKDWWQTSTWPWYVCSVYAGCMSVVSQAEQGWIRLFGVNICANIWQSSDDSPFNEIYFLGKEAFWKEF